MGVWSAFAEDGRHGNCGPVGVVFGVDEVSEVAWERVRCRLEKGLKRLAELKGEYCCHCLGLFPVM